MFYYISDRLRFTNVKTSDRVGGRAYACMAMNGIMRKSTQGPRYFVNPQGQYVWLYFFICFLLFNCCIAVKANPKVMLLKEVLCGFVSGLILWCLDNLWFDDLRAA